MITSTASHDHTLLHQFSIVDTQPVDTDTNGSSFASRICNILHCPYKCIKGAVKYTYETIDAHPKISIPILVVAGIAYAALAIYGHKSRINQGASNPIITASMAIVSVIITLLFATFTFSNYKIFTNRELCHSKIAEHKVIVAAISIIFIAAQLAVVIAALPPYN